MFERFTDSARLVVVAAQDEARTLGHTHIGTEHLLLGLARDETLAAQALLGLGIEANVLRATVVDVAGAGAVSPTGHVPFSSRAKSAIERSLREARQLGDASISTEHLLLGLLHDDRSTAAKVLAAMGIGFGQVRDQVSSLRATGVHREEVAAASEAPPSVDRTLTVGDIPFEMYAISATARVGDDEYTAEQLISSVSALAPHFANGGTYGLARGIAEKLQALESIASVSVTVRAPMQMDGSWFSETVDRP